MATDKLTYKIGADSTPFRNELKKASTAFERFGRNNSKSIARLKSAGLGAASGIAALGAAAATAAVALSVESVQAAAKFERAIVSAGAKANATSAQLKEMGEAALNASAGSEFSATQAANAMGFLAAAGFKVSEQMTALPSVLALASAGEIELAESADIASNVLSGFALKIEELGRVNDILVKAANSSNTSVRQLGEALSFAAPVAAGAGISIEETVAVIGKLSDAGIQAGRAGTSFGQIMMQMQAAAKKMGVTLSGADMASLGFAGSLKKLEAAGLNAQNAGEFFTSRAQVGLQAILVQGIPAVEGLEQSLESAGGTAEEVAAKKINTLAGAMNIFKGNAENLTIMLGQKLLPGVTGLVTASSNLANEIGKDDDILQQFADTMADMVVVAAGLAQAIGYLGSVAIRALGALSGNFQAGNEAANKLNATVDKATDLAATFSAQIKAGNPGLTSMEQNLLSIDAQLRSGNISMRERIKLEKQLFETQNAITIANLKDQASQAESLEKASDRALSKLSHVLEQRKVLEDLAKRDGLNLAAINSTAPLPTDMDPNTRAQVQQFRDIWFEVNYELDKTRNNLDGIERDLDAAYDAQDRLKKMGIGPAGVEVTSGGPKIPAPIKVRANVENSGLEKARANAIKAGESQAKGVIDGYNRILAEADATDLFAGYDRMMFEKMNAENTAAMEKMLADQKALAEKWAGIWDQASDKVVSVFSDSVGDAFLGVLEGNIEAVKDAVKNLIKEMVILAAKSAILSAFQSSTPGGAIPAALGFATGGYVSGPGTATSDSIPARLSNGEYVVKTAAVNHWGVGFMEAINNMKTPAQSRPQKFAAGGLASSSSQSSGQQPIRIINFTDPSEVEAVMAGAAGERIVLNILSRKSDQVRSILR